MSCSAWSRLLPNTKWDGRRSGCTYVGIVCRATALQRRGRPRSCSEVTGNAHFRHQSEWSRAIQQVKTRAVTFDRRTKPGGHCGTEGEVEEDEAWRGRRELSASSR